MLVSEDIWRTFFPMKPYIDRSIHFALQAYLRYPNIFLNILNGVDLPLEKAILLDVEGSMCLE